MRSSNELELMLMPGPDYGLHRTAASRVEG